MIDAESAIFDKVASRFSQSYPDGSCYSELVDTPAKFPRAWLLIEEDNATYEGSLDASHREHNATLLYSVNIYSNKISGAKQECKAIMELVDREMQNLGFTRVFCNQMKNADIRIYRVAARYRGVISEDYRIYRR